MYNIYLSIYLSIYIYIYIAHPQNVASLSRNYKYYFGRYYSELTQLLPIPFSRERSTCYSDKLNDFSVTMLSFDL